MSTLGPRLVVAGTHSGVGKTTVATGLMAALRARGQRVAAAKVGPDYIDPGYHALATGRPGRNLDPWMSGADAVAPLAARAAEGCDVLVVEGVMGLFDGSGEPDGHASTAHVARLLDAPIVLVVDASAMSGSVAALVHGFTTYDRRLHVAGVVLNQVASDAHEALLREALASLGTPILGVLRRDPALTWRDRHLGLVPVVEDPDAVLRALDRLAVAVEQSCDLDAVHRAAHAAPPLVTAPLDLPRRAAGAPVPVAVASGPAFSFTYPDNIEALEAAGAEILPFDPVTDARLPARARGLVAGGGFPEVFGSRLADNTALLADVRARVAAGLATWAECGGLLWLARSLDGRAMAGVVPCEARMTGSLTLGYRRARLLTPSPLGPPGTTIRGHEFHYSAVDPPGEALDLEGRQGEWQGGFASPTLLASYLHVHLGAASDAATRFVTAAAARPT